MMKTRVPFLPQNKNGTAEKKWYRSNTTATRR